MNCCLETEQDALTSKYRSGEHGMLPGLEAGPARRATGSASVKTWDGWESSAGHESKAFCVRLISQSCEYLEKVSLLLSLTSMAESLHPGSANRSTSASLSCVSDTAAFAHLDPTLLGKVVPTASASG